MTSSSPVASPAEQVRRVIARSSAGFFLGIVFGAWTICSQSFLEKNCRIESGQTKTILLLGLLLAAPFFVILTRWSARTGWKLIVPGGMLLAILVWFLFLRHAPAIAGTAGRTELNDQKEIRSTVAFIGKSRNLTRTTSTFTHYADGMQVVETKEDTVFADGRTSSNPRITFSGTLNTGDYWKIVAIFFLTALAVAMVAGPVAARLANAVPQSTIPAGIAAGLIPFIAVLLTATRPDDNPASRWYPLGIAAICFVTGALAIPSKGRTFAHVS